MNANELADELENTTRHRNETVFAQAATTLRLQASYIKNLEEGLDSSLALNKAQATRQSNNEPVAIRYDFDGYGYQYMDSGSGSDWQTRVEGELLYTHPVKTLTTEEIKEIAIQHIEKRLDGDRFGYFEFAKAVLKKAQEENNAKS